MEGDPKHCPCPNQLVLYLLCDGAQNDLFMTFPGTKVSCQACTSPSVPHHGDNAHFCLSSKAKKASCNPDQQQNNTQTINNFKDFLRSPCKMIQTPSLFVWNSCRSFNSKAPGRAHSRRKWSSCVVGYFERNIYGEKILPLLMYLKSTSALLCV